MSAPALRPHVTPLDWLMLALAIVSVGLLCYETWGPVSDEERRQIIMMDLIICAIFAAEFVYRWIRDPEPKTFPLRNWYEILGMIPASHPAIRGFRLFRIIRIVIILSRFGAAADRAFGEEFTYRLVNRFSNSLVDAIKEPITVAVLGEVTEVLQRGSYTKNIARALDENQEQLRATLLEKVRDDPQTRTFARLPFFDDVIGLVIDTTLRLAREVLTDKRTDELVADMLRENLEQIREAVKQREVEKAAKPGDVMTAGVG